MKCSEHIHASQGEKGEGLLDIIIILLLLLLFLLVIVVVVVVVVVVFSKLPHHGRLQPSTLYFG